MSADEAKALLEDPQNAPIDAPFKAAFALAKAMTQSPVDSEEIATALKEMQRLDLSVAAIDDAISIPFHFNFINRVADAFDFKLPQGEKKERLGRLLDLAKKVVVSKRPAPFLASGTHEELKLPVELVEGQQALLGNDAELYPSTREAIEGYTASLRGGRRPSATVPTELKPLLNKVATDAYKIAPEDIEALFEGGYNRDTIFELVVCAAWGAAIAPLEIAYATLQNINLGNDEKQTQQKAHQRQMAGV